MFVHLVPFEVCHVKFTGQGGSIYTFSIPNVCAITAYCMLTTKPIYYPYPQLRRKVVSNVEHVPMYCGVPLSLWATAGAKTMRKGILRKGGRDEEATATRRAFIPTTMADNHLILQDTLPIFSIRWSAVYGGTVLEPLIEPCLAGLRGQTWELCAWESSAN